MKKARRWLKYISLAAIVIYIGNFFAIFSLSATLGFKRPKLTFKDQGILFNSFFLILLYNIFIYPYTYII